MIEKALTGNKVYWSWVAILLALILLGIYSYSQQLTYGLTVTGMGRDVSWGVYIAQFTFLVGVAASAVMVVLPYYLHDYKEFGKIVIIGEFLAVSAATICLLFIIADMGHPDRVFYVLLYPHPNSMVFWDVQVLNGYLLINIVSGWTVLEAERKGISPPNWVKPIIYLSIVWAVSIHTVTAFLYAGTPGRHLWLTAVLAPRFLASAFAVGPSLLILISFILRKFADFDVGDKAIRKLATIATYAAIANFFFVGAELFTAFYSNIPGHKHSLQYLFFGLDGKYQLVPWMWFSMIVGIVSVLIMLYQQRRPSQKLLIASCSGIVVSLWIDKGIGLIIGGFVPSPMEEVVEYFPTFIEITVTLGIWAIGLLILTALLKVAVAVKKAA
ncbi:MAG: menaquinol oxidoreductase [Deltaproteobacteria bacterium]|jgi:molybdopterin-containing oxidoreductase family membrane subunit|uniref:Menaquinol oxidoreductase n=1 Tax=marine metagenome TaxID=408172 RepID=A0A381NI51_9ZZZZ|nr:menaquinol oxidoreductase [Deltaproteobacteria bacterium]MDP6307846.1 polysulfide reductase NrfD [SAR324 cluster bacterium]MDP6487744.1 polysulfide reductase NrfD [SAR324 cluster bacterium]MDP7170620.1 polysulfide reductase NrfD [SAR324 cluster bacterium]MDP7176176.1 polysulfide reductase NrfD [SAR324 cluster bacterium]|tara:strand:- start:480 stop:1631 length:1152 start_codon:yes stop_codon:yes gene_type:complete